MCNVEIHRFEYIYHEQTAEIVRTFLACFDAAVRKKNKSGKTKNVLNHCQRFFLANPA